MKLFLSHAVILGFLLCASSRGAVVPEAIVWGSPELAKAVLMRSDLAPVREGRNGKIRLTLPREVLRAGDRYLEVVLEHASDLKACTWQVDVLPSGKEKPILQSSHTADTERAIFRFDARTAGDGLLRVRLLENGKEQDVVEALFSVEKEKPLTAYASPKVLIDRPKENQSSSWLTFGLPLPRGAVWDVSSLGLSDEAGASVPAQFHSTALWSEGGSQKWLRVDALVKGSGPLHVVMDKENKDAWPSLRIRHEGRFVDVDTGVASYRVEDHGALLNFISSDAVPVSRYSSGGRGLYVVDQKNRLGRVAAKDTVIETEFVGPMVACFRVSGIYRSEEGEELARFTAWFTFAAGQAECRVTHHFILTRNTNEVWFKEIGWELDLVDWKAKEAVFAPQRGQSGRRVETLADRPSFTVAQTRHHRYGGDKDEIQLLVGKDTLETHEGEVGDWAAAVGGKYGLLMDCQEFARQHPKAFQITSGSINLNLFYPDAGEELDFRSPNLIKRWNAGGKLEQKVVAATEKLPTNAVGWSKTHQLVIYPTVSPSSVENITKAGNMFSFPVEACPDPWWTYTTRAVGSLYPRNRERFPEAESFIDEAFAYWEGEQEFLGEYGFVDFFAGPHHTRAFPQYQGRFRASYTLRNAFWLLYLRSGERKFRDMATWSNRVYLDSYLAGWDGPQRIRGLYIHSVGSSDPYAGLPFYWEGFTRAGFGTHTNLNQFLFDYYLTGNPRARDGVLSYAEGVKKWAKQSDNDWRILAVLRAVNQAYAFTWDPELRLIQENILNKIYDPQSPVFLTTKDRPYNNSTYKTQEDIAGLIEGWDLYGTTRYDHLATAVSRYWWRELDPDVRFERGISGRFLWEKTHDVVWAQRLWNAVREESTLSPESSSAETTFRFQGIPYALSVVADTNADVTPVASWAGAEVLTGRAGMISRKAPGEQVSASLLFDRSGLLDPPQIHALGNVSKIGLSLLSLKTGYHEATQVDIPKDTEATDLFISLPEAGVHQAFLNGNTPFMLYADGWWNPSPGKLLPGARIFFRVPKDTQDASIHFERKSMLFAPDGSPWPNEKPVTGKVMLPKDRNGVWSFSPVERGAVRVHHLPPFFSFDSANALFTADVAQLPLVAETPISVSGGFPIPQGATLSIEGKTMPLPFKEGTIEFFYKPGWDAFDIGDPVEKRLMTVRTNGHKDWSLCYIVNSQRAGWPGNPWSRSHVLEMQIETKGPARKTAVCIRRSLFEKDEWVHVAIVWGSQMFGHSAVRTEPAFEVKVFVNGTEGKFVTWPRQGNQAAAQPVTISFGPNFDGEIAALRISDTQRYTHDFIVPSAAQMASDAQTGLFFPFQEDTEGFDAHQNSIGKASLHKP